MSVTPTDCRCMIYIFLIGLVLGAMVYVASGQTHHTNETYTYEYNNAWSYYYVDRYDMASPGQFNQRWERETAFNVPAGATAGTYVVSGNSSNEAVAPYYHWRQLTNTHLKPGIIGELMDNYRTAYEQGNAAPPGAGYISNNYAVTFLSNRNVNTYLQTYFYSQGIASNYYGTSGPAIAHYGVKRPEGYEQYTRDYTDWLVDGSPGRVGWLQGYATEGATIEVTDNASKTIHIRVLKRNFNNE